MGSALVILVWLLNFGISIWNAYAVGLAWVETKHAGGWPRFMAWMGAIMSASGFSWCYLIVLAFAAQGLGWLTASQIVLFLRIGYVLLIPGILFSGMAIMLDSWAKAYRTGKVADIGIAAWNTYAEIHNTFHAIDSFGEAFGGILDALNSDSSESDSKKGGVVAVIVIFILVILALLSGAITTTLIIRRVAGNDQLRVRRQDEEEMKLAKR